MPAPIAIRDPATYYEKPEDPATALGLGEDPVVPLRNFLAMQKSNVTSQPSTITNEQASPRNKHYIDDISISPRLLGYVFSCISSAVGMISASVFYVRETILATPDTLEKYAVSIGMELNQTQVDRINARLEDMSKSIDLYFGTGGSLVQVWKVYGCIAVEGLLTIITMAIVIAHFDSILCVKKNRVHFRDGSLFERNLLIMLIILSVCALYISTSKFSVGEAQANVFFSTWTNFISCAVNYEIWRKGSGRNHTFQNTLLGRDGQSSLIRHWFILAIFATIVFLSTIDFFVNNNIVQDEHNFNCLDLDWANKWVWFSVAGAVTCWAVVLLQRYCKVELLVRIIEVIVSLGIIGVYGYIVAEFTGGRLDQVPCPSNLYFSVWGGFFLSVWIFSTMVQESRSLVKDE